MLRSVDACLFMAQIGTRWERREGSVLCVSAILPCPTLINLTHRTARKIGSLNTDTRDLGKKQETCPSSVHSVILGARFRLLPFQTKCGVRPVCGVSTIRFAIRQVDISLGFTGSRLYTTRTIFPQTHLRDEHTLDDGVCSSSPNVVAINQ